MPKPVTASRSLWLAAGLCAAVGCGGVAFADTLKIVARSFIPAAVPDNAGYVRKLPDGRYAIPSPNPAEPNICYLADGRDFSLSETAGARWTASAELTFIGGAAQLKTNPAVPGPTHAVACDTGAPICTLSATVDAVKWGAVSETATEVTVPFTASAGNPCITPQAVVPDIKLNGTYRFNKITGKATFSGTGSKFPSLESFVVYQAKAQSLFKAPASGTVFNIPLQRPVAGDATLPIYDGEWRSLDPAGRFVLKFVGSQAHFVERSATGQVLDTPATLTVGLDGAMRVERANDVATLRFLGFAESLIPDILAHGPQPSYISFRRDAVGLSAQWAGLVVIKDEHAHFKELKQPGSTPPKPYSFQR